MVSVAADHLTDPPAALPRRAARIPPETQVEIVRLAVHQLSQAEISRRTGANRKTVKRVLDRTRAALLVNADVRQERAEAIAVYREVQRFAWEAAEKAIERGRSPIASLAEVRQAQARIDALQGLTPASPEDPELALERLKAIVVSVIRTDAPELAPRLAARLREAGHDDPR